MPSVAAPLSEADVLEGLEPFAEDELRNALGIAGADVAPGALTFRYNVPPDALLDLRSVVAVFRVLHFDAPRPKALLGHQHFEAIVGVISHAQSLWPRHAFRTLRLSAAGADTAVLRRLRDELAARTGLDPADDGDMLLRLRRARAGWQVLVRLSPRPLATRAWRVDNLPGALNATVAHAMMSLTQPRPADRVLNMACGSATLLIERLALGPARVAIGCDIDERALASARANLQASGYDRAVRLEPWDATQLPLPDRSVDVICADLPFGQLVGSHRDNEVLYPRLVAEATRVAATQARMVLISHEVRLLERVAEQWRAEWRLRDIVRVRVGGMTPRIYLFRRVQE
jgi:23S rRNA G2445 N2-methylase RlmL